MFGQASGLVFAGGAAVGKVVLYCCTVVYPVHKSWKALQKNTEDKDIWLFYWLGFAVVSWLLYLLDGLVALILIRKHRLVYGLLKLVGAAWLLHPKSFKIRTLKYVWASFFTDIVRQYHKQRAKWRVTRKDSADGADEEELVENKKIVGVMEGMDGFLRMLDLTLTQVVDVLSEWSPEQLLATLLNKVPFIKKTEDVVSGAKEEALESKAITLARSNFKAVYNTARMDASQSYQKPMYQHEVFHHVLQFLLGVATKKSLDRKNAHRFFARMQRKIIKDASNELLNSVSNMVIRLWTSDDVLEQIDVEFCTLLNEVLREDLAGPALESAVRLVVVANSLIVARGQVAKIRSSCPDFKVYRGTGMPYKYVAWFKSMEKKQYRVPMMLATSVKPDVTLRFLDKVSTGNVHVMFTIEIDEDSGCDHALYLEGLTGCSGEVELLFTAYSAFTVESVSGVAAETAVENPVHIHLKAAVNNKDVPEDVPLAQWH